MPFYPYNVEVMQYTPWQQALQCVITSIETLCARLQLDPTQLASHAATQDFALRVPESYLRRIEPGNPQDPLLLQVLPQAQELLDANGYTQDALEEESQSPIPGLLHKYPSRVLFVLSGACAINCRYCFRRHFPYQDHTVGFPGWARALDYIQADPKINEVILSGGDPLIIKDQALAKLYAQVAEIPHVTRLRIHSRLPVVIPERVTPEFMSTLTSTRLQSIVVIHANHANEIDHSVRQALLPLRQAGVTLLNQSVLLRGVNNSVDTLAALSEALFSAGVLPYYLHALDRVQGSAHFAVDDSDAALLMAGLRQRLPGFLVPTFVREIPGELSKTPII